MTAALKDREQAILVLGDDPEWIDDAAALLQHDFKEVYKACGWDEIIARVEQVEPVVLVLAFSKLVEAERSYLELYRKSLRIQAIPHDALLACAGPDVETAYDLFKRSVFDDYVVIRPLYDRHRLAISVRKSLERRALANAATDGLRPVVQLGNKMAQISGSIAEHASALHGLRGEMGNLQQHVRERVISRMSDLSSRYLAQALGREKIEDEAMRTQFRELARKELEPDIKKAFSHTEQHLLALSERLDQDVSETAGVMGNLTKITRLARQKILVVDDDPFYCDILKKMLEDAGFEALIAGDAGTGVTFCGRARPDLALIDYQLPDLSGVEMVRTVKNIPSLRQMPLIMLTGHSERDVVQAAKAAGVLDFIVKPGSAENILKKVRGALNV